MLQDRMTEDEFAVAFDRYADAIFRHCYLRVLSRDVAQQLTKETFIRLWEYVSAGNHVDVLRLLLYRFADQAVRHARVSPRADSPECALLQDVPPEDRGVLILRYVDGFSLPEIGSILGGTVQDHARTLQKSSSALSSLLFV